MEIVREFLSSQLLTYVGGAGFVTLILYILKQIPNDKIKSVVGKFFYTLGVTMTLGLSKWKYTKTIWNSTIEPWFIDLVDNLIGEAVKQFISGLRTDNISETK